MYLIYSEESPEERRFAEGALRARLEGRGLTVRSEADFLAGTNLVRGRSGAVQDCCKALILLTENSSNSSWCTLELLLALEKSYRLNKVSLVVLKIGASREWKFQLALEMLNVVPRVDLSSFTELSEDEGKLDELARKLQDTSRMEDIQPAGNIAHAQVWSHYTGLLSYLLPEIERLIKETEYYKLDPSRFPLKLYELVPERCNCPRIIEDIPKNELGKRIRLMPWKTSKIEYFRAGNKREVEMSIYEIKDTDGSVYYCLMEIPAVLSGIQTMVESKSPEKLREIDLQLHIKRFYYTLGGLLDDRSFPQTYDRARVITYDEQQSGFVLADVVLNEVKKDLCSPNEKKVPPQHFQHAECEFDAFVFIHEGDENTSDEITHFLEGKGVKLMRNDRIGQSILNISDVIKRCRWIIPILSKTSLKDPVFAHCCLMLVGDILEKKELRMIPVLTGGAAYEDVPEVIRMVTLTVADNPEYLNRLHQTIKGNTIPFETESLLPAGDVVYVLAWNYAVNYLEKVMPGLEHAIAETLQKHNKRPTSCRKKLYLIVPKSCECNQTLTVKEPRIQLLDTTPPAYVDKSGRKYTFDMYQFENNGREHYFVGLYPAAVACIHDMYKTKRAGVNEDTMVSQARKFCEEIANVLNHKVSANFTNLCEVVFYDDREMSLITEMTKRIESL